MTNVKEYDWTDRAYVLACDDLHTCDCDICPFTYHCRHDDSPSGECCEDDCPASRGCDGSEERRAM